MIVMFIGVLISDCERQFHPFSCASVCKIVLIKIRNFSHHYIFFFFPLLIREWSPKWRYLAVALSLHTIISRHKRQNYVSYKKLSCFHHIQFWAGRPFVYSLYDKASWAALILELFIAILTIIHSFVLATRILFVCTVGIKLLIFVNN